MAYLIQPSDRVQPEIGRIAADCIDRALSKLEGLEGVVFKKPVDAKRLCQVLVETVRKHE